LKLLDTRKKGKADERGKRRKREKLVSKCSREKELGTLSLFLLLGKANYLFPFPRFPALRGAGRKFAEKE